MGLSGRPGLRVALLAAAAAALAWGVAGGLARLGAAVDAPAGAAHHAFLMIAGFLGTVISLERAVAFRGGIAFVAPALGALGTLALLAGFGAAASALWIAAACVLLGVSIALARRQPLPHMRLLALAAAAWLAASLLHATHRDEGAIAFGFVFLVLTIAAERLEMTRLMRRRPAAGPLFAACVALLLAGAAATAWRPGPGSAVLGAAFAATAAWLAAFDIARRTRQAEGFAGYAAHALLAGYAWLAAGGLGWIALAAGLPVRDAALHAVALGFVMSMIFGHAPLVIPAVAGLRMRYTAAFYGPLALLHLSLAARVAADFAAPPLRAATGWLNAAALVAFAAVLLTSLHGARRIPRAESPHASH